MSLKNIISFYLFICVSSGFSQSTASLQVHSFTIVAPQLDSLRTIRIYLPAGYENSAEAYPVLYMHDAQNLFDTTTAFSGEWQVDEFLDTQKGQKVIVVGIDHGNEKRISELTPFANEKYGGGNADAYLDFIVSTLKPHIDATYRTLPNSQNTAIMGSSLGGLVSFYAAIKYPDVFGKAGVFSPSFWFSDKIYDLAGASEINHNTRFYLLGGTSEDESLVEKLQQMKDLLLKKALPKENVQMKIVSGGMHNEAFWSREFPEAFQWLFPKNDPEK